jgi:hypothetical protein
MYDDTFCIRKIFLHLNLQFQTVANSRAEKNAPSSHEMGLPALIKVLKRHFTWKLNDGLTEVLVKFNQTFEVSQCQARVLGMNNIHW